MKSLTTLIIALPIATTLTAGTFTQTHAATAGEDNNKAGVSQINGELVPVGDQNRYQYEHPRFNVSTNPLGFIVGSYGASVSYAPHKHVALRLDANYFNDVGDDISGFELGVGAPIYFRKAYSGFFLEPGVVTKHLASKEMDTEATIVGPQVLIGWHWFWDSGLNVALAVGAGRNFNGSDEEGFEEYDDVFANGYLRFGYAF